ncbi:P-loop containing nucleoside triphosphate hydrolase protein [Sporormia fimetaria CBS 119925]|uniref:P-loop containing nucleoside triphosphate hydrolase protein n=1 Tax=Sporormia fimetaria CBS 119925 TaxID=1340428 RepID=A0A6A6V1K1_9PLEO|nr:P-loop containing nucleoside triphosphate hydrolase protein [Sporormia fimetaria CBS 119925]
MFALSRHALRTIPRAAARYTPPVFRRASTAVAATVVPSSAPVAIPKSPLQITLREYQEECIQSVLSYLEKGHKRLGVSLATGSGKTVIFTHLIDRVPEVNDATQTLILAHRRELVEQAARHCTLAYPDNHVDIEMGNHHASGAADITVASIQSIMSGDRLAKFDPARYKLVLVDEAHHIVSAQYLELLQHFGLRHPADWTEVSAPALVGVSATFSRFDGRKLGAVIDHIVYHRDYVDMIEENWLSDVLFTTVQISADLTKVRSGANGDFASAALSKAINTNETNEIVVQSYLAKAKDRKSTLVFCVDLNHVSGLTATFRRHGIEAHFVTGDTPKRLRSARVDAFRAGKYPVLLNCGVFTEGTDIPNIDCVLLARPTKSRNLLIQMIGRGMRLHAGKQNCHIIDLVAALSTGVVSTPTLFGLDPSEIVENANSDEMQRLKERKEKEKQREHTISETSKTSAAPKRSLPGTITFTDYDSVHDLLADSSTDRYIRQLSEYAWVAVGDAKYVLTTNSGNYLLIEPAPASTPSTDADAEDPDSYQAKYYRKLPPGVAVKSPYATPRVIATSTSFEHIVHAADTFAGEVFEHMWIAKNQGWRRRPASEAQVEFLNKFRGEEEKLSTKDLSKGKAGDMITRIKHGAKGRYVKASVKKRVEERLKGREERVRQREVVKVGPLER